MDKFSDEKIERMKRKARNFSNEEIQEFIIGNLKEISRCVQTNKILGEILEERMK